MIANTPWAELVTAVISVSLLFAVWMLFSSLAVDNAALLVVGVCLTGVGLVSGTVIAYAALAMTGHIKRKPQARFWHIEPYQRWNQE